MRRRDIIDHRQNPPQRFFRRLVGNGSGTGIGMAMALFGIREAKANIRPTALIHNGPIPEYLHCLHRCDNPPCLNHEHLFLGTAADNAADRDAKGRHHFGTGGSTGCSPPNRILSNAEVANIKGPSVALFMGRPAIGNRSPIWHPQKYGLRYSARQASGGHHALGQSNNASQP
jgi:HNH endonuclease